MTTASGSPSGHGLPPAGAATATDRLSEGHLLSDAEREAPSGPSRQDPPLTIVTFHPRFKRAALREVRGVAPDAEVLDRLDTDSLLVGSASGWLGPALAAALPTFVLHVAPVSLTVPLLGDRADLDVLRHAVADEVRLPVGERFAVQARRGASSVAGRHGEALYTSRDVEIAIGRPLEMRGLVVDVLRPEHVVSVYLHRRAALVGVSRSTENLAIQADPHRLVSGVGTSVSRAEHKLEEAIDVFGLTVDAEVRALDLGAAPGGWTKVLADRGARVTAIDPGALADPLCEMPNVEHLRARVEYVELPLESYDLIVNDMNLDDRESAAMMCFAARWVRRGAPGVMTLKLATKHPWAAIERTYEILNHAYEVLRIRQMFVNRQEVSLLLRRRPELATGWEEHLVRRGSPAAR